MGQEPQPPAMCGNGHKGKVWMQHSWCPQCHRETWVFRCSAEDYSCHWEAATQQHYDNECTPDDPVWIPQPRGTAR